MKAIVNTDLNERTELPSVNAPIYNYYKKGDEVNIVDIVNGDPCEGNKVWYKLDNGRYVWSGGVEGERTIVKETPKTKFRSEEFYWLHDYKIPQLWEQGLTGKGVKIAVLDSGLSLPHEDLIIDLNNCADKSKSIKQGINDMTGHGTHCTGVIKANNNGFGVQGIAFDCDLYFCKTRNDEIKDDLRFLKKAMEWAIEKKVHIISISQGAYKDNSTLKQTLKKAEEQNIIVVCAGGNSIENVTQENDVLFPAKYEECISVGSVDKYKSISKNTLASRSLTIGAPGSDIKSTFLKNDYKLLSGTSQATPIVSGVLALMIQYCIQESITYSLKLFKEWMYQTSDNSNHSLRILNPTELLKKIKSV